MQDYKFTNLAKLIINRKREQLIVEKNVEEKINIENEKIENTIYGRGCCPWQSLPPNPLKDEKKNDESSKLNEKKERV